MTRSRPSHEILSGDSADVYFARAETILEKEGLDPLVTMEVFTRQDAVLCGIDEARNLLGHVLARADPAETKLETLHDGDLVAPKEVVLRIQARYRRFGLYETAFLGMLAQSTGWATAARHVVDAAAPDPVNATAGRSPASTTKIFGSAAAHHARTPSTIAGWSSTITTLTTRPSGRALTSSGSTVPPPRFARRR